MRRRGRLALIVLAVLGVAIAVTARWVSFERHHPLIERELSQAIGLELRIRGPLRLDLLPTPHLEATDVLVANLPGRPSPHLLEIGRLTLALDDWRFLFGSIAIDAMELRDVDLRIETDAEGRFGLDQDLESLADQPGSESREAPLEFHIRRLAFEDLRVFYDREGEQTVRSLWLDSMAFEADDLDASIGILAHGEVDGSPIQIAGRIGSLKELFAPTRPFPVSLRGRVFEADVELEGALAEPTALRGVDVSFSATLEDLAGLSPEHEDKLAVLGPIRMTGRLKKPDGVISIQDLHVTSQRDTGARVTLKGSVRDLQQFQGIDLELHLEADDLAFLEPLVERPLPEGASLAVHARIEDRDGSLGVEGRLRTALPEERMTLELTGGQDDLSRIGEIDLQFELSAADLAVIGEVFALEQELPAIGPVRASGRLRDEAGALGIAGLAARIGDRDETWVEIDGDVQDVTGQKGVRLSGRFGAQDLHEASPYLGYEPPNIGPIRGSAALSDEDGSLGLESVLVTGGREGSFEIRLSGDLDDLRELDEVFMEAKLEARDLAVVGAIFGAELPPIGPVEFAGRVAGSNERLVAAGATARLDKTRFEGDFSGAFAHGTRPRLRGRVRSPHLYLDDIGIEPRPDRPDPQPGEKGRDAPHHAWDDDAPLPFERLRAMDLELDLRADRVTGRADLEIVGLVTEIKLEDGTLSIRQTDGGYQGGTVQTALRIDARTPLPQLSMRADASGVDVTRLALQFDEKAEAAGLMDAHLDVRSWGDTPRELRSHLEGEWRSVLKEGTLASRYGREFILELVRVSIPSFTMTKQAPRVSCLVTEFVIEDGIATAERVFIESPTTIVTATGEVDLGRKQLDLRFTPRPLDPGLLSVAVTVDVKGSFDAPVFSPVPRTFATSLARGILSNAMKPAGTVLSPFRRRAAKPDDPCATSARPRTADEAGTLERD